MRIPELPKHLVIVGGGFVACEFAHIFSALGVRITMVIRGGSLLRHLDDTLSRRFTRIAASKWEVRSHRNILGSHENRSGIVLELDDGSELQADAVLVPPGGAPTAIDWTPTHPESRSTIAVSWSTNTNDLRA